MHQFDNCYKETNHDQADVDGDGKGDVCDNDDDGDGYLDTSDNCPLVKNSDQTDSNSELHTVIFGNYMVLHLKIVSLSNKIHTFLME